MKKEISLKDTVKQAWKTVFSKGRKAWFSLVVIVFIFSLLGTAGSESTAFVSGVDQALGISESSANVELLQNALMRIPFIRDLDVVNSEAAMSFVAEILKSQTWLIDFLGANEAYFLRNVNAVAWTLLLASFLAVVFKVFVQNTLVVGRNRYVLENCFEEKPEMKRALSVLHLKSLWNLVSSMFMYHLTLLLWWLTIGGGIYKMLEYAMVPWIFAENPEITWKEAKKMSSEMTDGRKWNLFKTYLGIGLFGVLKAVPLFGLLVVEPVTVSSEADIYLQVRNAYLEKNSEACALLVERSFDASLYTDLGRSRPHYVLEDLSVYRLEDAVDKSYSIADYILLFISFAFVGWCWEVFYALIRTHELANRGVLHGPWLPIYGAGGVLCIMLLDRYKDHMGKLFLMIVGLAGIMEYLTSWFLDYFDNASYWSYKGMFANLNGRICFAGLFAFGIGGSFAIYTAGPFLRQCFHKLGKKKEWILAILLISLFLADVIYCMVNGFNTGSGVGGVY